MPQSQSGDIYIKREKWRDGYHSVARENGKFISTSKWTGKESTERTLNKIREGNITEDRSRYTFLIHAQNPDDQTRSLAVFTKRRIFLGSKKKRQLDIKPIKEAAQEKYKECKFKPSTFKFFRIYDGDLML